MILPEANKNIWLATRNLKNIETTRATALNIEQILKSETILLSKESLDIINSTYGMCYA
jgi:large subunit ribosomal protein L4